MHHSPLPRLDENAEIRSQLLQYCRLEQGQIWEDDISGHRVGCIDAADPLSVKNLLDGQQATLAIHDPPYNLVAFAEREVSEFIAWCRPWIQASVEGLKDNSALYIWLGADQNAGFQPLPEFMIMMREFSDLQSRSFITMRNQRGYGTQKNWMATRQELLSYSKGKPVFHVQYTDIPKVLRGYYKKVNGELTENLERSKSDTIRASNVWIDVQQIFYRMEENVSGCFAQKPLKAIDRIVDASSNQGDLVLDFFAHSGTTLLSCERLERRCYTADIDPIFCEITIRRLLHFRSHGKLGWQNGNPFPEYEISNCSSNGHPQETLKEALLF